MRVWIPLTVLGLLTAVILFAGEEPAPQRGKNPSGEDRRLIDVNQASAEDWARLPGIGPKLAARIVSFRKKHGPFRRVEDLLAIEGIGYGKWKAIRPFLKLGPAKGDPASIPVPKKNPA